MKLAENTILITGGTSGIGLAFALEFMKAGSTVIICGRSEERLQKVRSAHPGLITKVCDVKLVSHRTELFNWIAKEHPNTNVLINNAGIQFATNLILPVNDEKIQEEIETNLVAPLHLSSLFAKDFSSKKESAIINITSGLAFTPIAFMPVYCATKAALHSLTISLRHQLRNTSVKVFEIAPPSVDTNLGIERREDKSQSHGDIPVSEFIQEAMQAIKNDDLEAAVGMAKGLRLKREEAFQMLNSNFP